MGENEHKIELGDLPVECVDEILKKIRTREFRNDARLVSKTWLRSIDSDSSCERYVINKKTTKHCGITGQPEFRNFISQFLNFNRKKISFRFEYANLRDTELFWAEKGPQIIWLNFESRCYEIPFELVFSKCTKLRETYIHNSGHEIMYALESLASNGSYNNSLNSLTIYGQQTTEMVIRLVELISKVFPSMKKVALFHLHRAENWYCEELREQFIQLKYELELNTRDLSVVFNSSSEIPVRVRKVSINDWTMFPYEFFKNVEDISYDDNMSGTVQLSMLKNLLSQYPMLQSLKISCGNLKCDLQKPVVGNRLTDLYLLNCRGKFTINTVFLESFRFLKTIHLCNVSRATFTDILLNMEHLEELNIDNLIRMADKSKINKEPKLLVHGNLKKLKVPAFFSSRARTVYHFDNLTEITVRQNGISLLAEVHDVDKIIRRFQCPNLRDIDFQSHMMTSKAVDFHWLQNLISMFPKLRRCSFHLSGSADLFTENQIFEFHRMCPDDILHIFDECMPMGMILRHLMLITFPK